MKNKSKFSGLSFSLFKVTANAFYGYGIEFLTVGYSISRIITTSYSKTFFYINLYLDRENEGAVWRLSITLFFFLKLKWENIRVEPKIVCSYCLNRYAKPEHDFEGKVYCSKDCIMDHKDEYPDI